MQFTAVIEQTYNYKKRMKYIAQTNSFIATDQDSLGYVRNVRQPYGWMKESGTPPQPHLDIYLMTDVEFELGDEVPVDIIGVFWRSDGDHKLVGVLPDRQLTDFSQLNQSEKEALSRLYKGKFKGENWYGRTEAEKVINDFFTHRKIIIDGTNFSTLDGFYDEMEKLLTRNLTWRTGHNMDAFHDLLRGGFGVHEYGEGIDFYWTHAKKSKQDLGYEATLLYWEKILKKCHPSNKERILQKISDAQNGVGQTLFDLILMNISDKNSVYDHNCYLLD